MSFHALEGAGAGQHGGYDVSVQGKAEEKAAACAQGTEQGGGGDYQRGQGFADGAEPDDGRGSAQVHTKVQYGQRHQHGGDGENGAGNKELTGVAAKGQGGYFSGKKEKIHEDKFYKNAGLRK